MSARLVVYVDCDDTLVRTAGSKRIPVSGVAAAAGNCREALERAIVRTSFIIFVETATPLPGDICEHYRRLADNRLIKT